MSQSITTMRARAFKSQNGRCFYCNIPMWLAGVTDSFFRGQISEKAKRRIQCTTEHLRARCDGGSNAAYNLVAACHFCNQARHRRTNPPDPIEFRKLAMTRVLAGKWHPTDYHQLYRNYGDVRLQRAVKLTAGRSPHES